MIGAFQSSHCSILFQQVAIPLAVSCGNVFPLFFLWLWASLFQEFSIPVSLLMLLGWSLHVITSIEKGYNSRWLREQQLNRTMEQWGRLKCTNHSQPFSYKWCRMISQPHRLKKSSSKQLKRGDLHLKWLHREAKDNSWVALSRNGKINWKPFGGWSQEIEILQKTIKEGSSPSFRSIRYSKLQIFIETLCTNL